MYIHGIIFAVIALLCWAFGDYFIQKTSREYGVWTSLFCIVFSGAVVLFPFVIKKLPFMFQMAQLPLLLLVSVATCAVALVEFKAFQVGKIVVVEPIMSFELPMTVLLGVFLLQESLTWIQVVLVIVAFIGILLTSSKNIFKTKISLEKGVTLAGVSVFLMAIVNFTTGLASQNVGAVEVIWFMNTALSLVCIGYFSLTRSWGTFFAHIKKYPKESFLVALFDNGAWLAYSAAVIIIPISLAITVSEGYIALAMVLGVVLNKEKLSKYQWFGAVASFIAVVVLSCISG